MEVISNEYKIKSTLNRLELIIDGENQRIGRDPQFDVKVSNDHKSRCLYELAILVRDTRMKSQSGLFAEDLNRLKTKLALNARRVQAHMEAVRSVADLIKTAVQEEEADGTYSQQQFGYCDF